MSEARAGSTVEPSNAKRKPVGKDVSTQRRVARAQRHFRLRKKIGGTPTRPRMLVKRSSRHIQAMLVDDLAGHTLVAASTLEADVRAMTGDKSAKATKVGELVATRAREAGISTVVLDRGGNAYHGRIAALADAARAAGLEF